MVFVPYLIYATGFPAAYTLFNWILTSCTEVPVVNDQFRQLILPLLLPWIPITLWLRHRIKVLKWPRNNDPFLGYMLAWLGLALPTIIIQEYVEAATGKHTQLTRISQIAAKPASKYYTVEKAHVDKVRARSWISTTTTGRHAENWQMRVYYVMPLLDVAGETSAVGSPVWLGVTYRKAVSNRLSEEEKRVELDNFVRHSHQRLNDDNFGWISYFTVVGQNENRRGFEAAWKRGAIEKQEAPLFLLRAQAEPFEDRTGNRLSWFWITYGVAACLWLLLAIGMKIDAPMRRRLLNERSPNNTDLKVAWQFVIPRRDFFFTPVLFYLNLLVWLLLLVRGQGIDAISSDELLSWGALYSPAVTAGELWRFVTFLFVHAGIMHLAGNMISFGLVGFLVERSFGLWWFGGVYFATGFAGGVASLLWKPTVIIIGASGAIFGVAGFGLTLLLLKRKRFAAERPLLLKAAGVYFGLNLLMGALLPNTDLVGHVAGLVSGVLIGLVSSPLISDAPRT